MLQRTDQAADVTAQYRPDIDGLRAIAVVSVIAYHYGVSIARGGFVGVDVFFVISGYLISSIILRELRQGTFSLDFYVRRIKRIVPIALVVVCATSLVAVLFPQVLDRDGTLESAFFAAASLSNFYFLAGAGYFANDAATQPLLHFWSLAIEEQFYLVWPLTLAGVYGLFKRPKFITLATLGIALVSFVLCLQATASNPSEAFYLPQYRVWELLIGAALAPIGVLGVSRNAGDIVRATALIVLAVCVVVYDDTLAFPGIYALAPCVAAAGLVLPLGSRGRIDYMLSLPPVRLIGLISYSLYLWHWPVLVIYRGATGNDPSGLALVAIIAAVFGLSYLTWKYIEQPARRWSPTPLVKWSMCAAFASVLASGVYAWTASAEVREWTAERYIVREQVRRAVLAPRPDIGFFGDSSCLTGVYSPILTSDLNSDVASYCMFGDAGPSVDAIILRKLRERQALPQNIVYMVHAAQFERTEVVRVWDNFASDSAENKNGVLDLIGSPGTRLQGAFTARYKRPSQLVEELRRTGSLVDPTGGVQRAIPVPYDLSTAYKASLVPLIDELSRIDRDSVFLVLAPIPEGDELGNPVKAAVELASLLGIAPTNILRTPAVMSKDLFAKNTHLNERGRDAFSHMLAEALDSKKE
ncbi:acyltransferase family protein [Devosia sp. D6-9]|nr:acyltransferase family protein [Devosia sp. D6-9]